MPWNGTTKTYSIHPPPQTRFESDSTDEESALVKPPLRRKARRILQLLSLGYWTPPRGRFFNVTDLVRWIVAEAKTDHQGRLPMRSSVWILVVCR